MAQLQPDFGPDFSKGLVPAIAQGLPKDTHFKIGRTELDKLSKE